MEIKSWFREWGGVAAFLGAVVVIIVLVLWANGGCNPPESIQECYGSESWIFGEHPVHHLGNYQGVQGELDGRLLGGSDGSIDTEPMLSVEWEKEPGERYTTTLPCSRFRFLTDEGAARPAIPDRYRSPVGWLAGPTIEFQFGFAKDSYCSCYPSQGGLEGANPNDYLMDGHRNLKLEGVTIRGSSVILGGICLPK